MLFLFWLYTFGVPLLCYGHSHRHDGSQHSHMHASHGRDNAADRDAALDEALRLIAKGQAAMARANEAIIANPRRNRLEVLNATELNRAQTPPPLLDYHSNATTLEARSENTRGSNGTEDDMRYTVPDELIEAARLVSQHWTPPNENEDVDYETAIHGLQTYFQIPVNDTNMMPPMLQFGSGLVSRVEEPPSAFRYGGNASDLVQSTPQDQDEVKLKKRASGDWWIATIRQRGSSPFAPSGYQVWRNVKDFGAKGDGVADDTEAINKAISSGGRCGGGNCTGSTIYPATVYFPPGKYKVSSSIIQYYNTELIGNPFELPKIVAAPSFVGLGVITSNVYTGETSQWYLNQNNFLRSIRNFIIDIRATPQWGQVCGIHWQVAQGTSLENIHFYMTTPEDDASTTQQGIYMENGSGGFLSDLYFVGGKFGAYMGNQQFTASGLYFQDAETAIQIHWDWGWTMQNIVVVNCQTGISIVGGAGGGIGSLFVTDMQMRYGRVGIATSVMSDNSTALLLSNSGFYAVDTVVKDMAKGKVLLPGSSKTRNVDNWGFGMVTNANGDTTFLNGAVLDSPNRDSSLVVGPRNQFFTRRRPKYDDVGYSQILDARAYGAQGDGKTDDTAVLNHLFATAANMSAIVYIPFGVYLIQDTIDIPVGSRIIGQAWAQIMATGSKFSNALQPRVAVRVGLPNQVGVVEIQSLIFTVKGATAGAVLMEWNVHESAQGSAGLWDTHFRVGGAAGTDLTANDCPKLSGKVNPKCIAASLMLHLTSESSAYLENVWMWTADHDFDTAEQTQIDIYAGRGMLVESNGPTWLWGTSVEHCVLYQYQLSGAKNIVMGLIQTESPYFQSVPTAPAPFLPGAFPDDPEFHDCSPTSKTCGVSWAVRLIDSSEIHILSAGLYSFFSRYDQTCINSGRHNCQDKIFYTEQSFSVWIYNLVTIGSIEMISPLNGKPTLGKPNRNGFASSLLAWLGGAKQMTGRRDFAGYRIHDEGTAGLDVFPAACQNALKALVRCDNGTSEWTTPEYHGIMPDEVDVNSVCDAGCAQSISDWTKATDVIAGFGDAEGIDAMKTAELCSDCYIGRLKMMQSSNYSIYSQEPFYQGALKAAVSRCSLANQPTATKDSPFPENPTETPLCLSGVTYTTQSGDTCNSLALKYKVSSAAIFIGNPAILDCNEIVQGVSICLPLPCDIYQLDSEDTCLHVEVKTGLDDKSIMQLNPWIDETCENLQSAPETLGSVLCISIPGGDFTHNVTTEDSDPAYSEYGSEVVSPPAGAILAEDTTTNCGAWQEIKEGDDCAQVLVRHHISLLLFTRANPSVSMENCSADLVPGLTYCVNPT
ncbi:pectate lyase superfamily protein-domain-containing protein, partial [Stachybotrys elegans]